MILTPASSGTVPITPQSIAMLKECGETERYSECGWCCITGWKNDKVHVRVHANSWDEFDFALGLNENTWPF